MAKRQSLAARMREAVTPDVPQATIANQPDPAQERPARSTSYYAATRAGKKKVTASLHPDAHKQLKRLALDRDMTTEALLVEAINDLFKKYAKRPIA